METVWEWMIHSPVSGEVEECAVRLLLVEVKVVKIGKAVSV